MLYSLLQNFFLKYKLLIAFSSASIFLSVFLTISILRLCSFFPDNGYLSLLYFMCGNSSASQSSFRKITKVDLSSVESLVNESKEFSIDRGTDAKKLIDESLLTYAAPASNKIDYQITFVGSYKIKQVVINWGDYGVNRNYINKWSLESSKDGTNWTVIESGNSPQNNKTVINKRFSATALRLKAEAENDWIGVHELDIIGMPL